MALTKQELQRRKGKITSSTAAACLGLDPQCSEIEAWIKIRAEDPAPEPEKIKVEDTKLLRKAIDRGNRLEDYILEYGSDYLTDWLGESIVMTPAPYRSFCDWMGDSCDALYFPDNGQLDAADPFGELAAIGEGKSASLGVGFQYGEEGTDEMPHHTLIQSHIHLIHWPEAEFCVVPVLIGGYRFEFKCYLVERDPEFEEIIQTDLHAWHKKHVIGDVIPQARCDDESWLMRRYPKALKGAMPMTPELQQLAWAKWRASKQESFWKKKVCDLKAKIKQILGECSISEEDWGKVSWLENQSRFVTDWQGLAITLFEVMKKTEGDRIKTIAAHTSERLGNRTLRVHVKKPFHDQAMTGETNVQE